MTRNSSRTLATAAHTPTDLERAMKELSALGASLARSYQSLEERAARVEGELEQANAALARKVDELDAVTAELEAVLEALPTGVVVRDARGCVLRANDAALAALGRSRDQLAGSALALAPETNSGETWQEFEFVREDGRRAVLAHRRAPIRAKGRARACEAELFDDRTALVELAERMHALDKLAALGNMAGGIAHELRNPMMAAKGFAALLADKLPAGEQSARWARLIVEGIDEANAVLTSMMSLASPDKLQLETVAAQTLADEVFAMALRDVGIDARDPRWRVDARVTTTEFGADRIKLRQALRNLVANALQAQPEGGAVLLEIVRADEQMILRVSDAGPGIPRALATRVLEPFFTTRAQGSGLGLALVERIARLHGGELVISSERSPLGGASIALTIPYRS